MAEINENKIKIKCIDLNNKESKLRISLGIKNQKRQ
jgi:hypothetical protein